jgi:sulfoxide reductase heme-binding subunit YedZ
VTLWYLARAGGLVALAALTLATALGAIASVRQPDDGAVAHRVRFLVQYLHRAAAVTGLLTLVLHIGSLVVDAKSGVNLRAVVVPLTATYRPVAVAVGSLALLAFVFTAVVGAARGRLSASESAVRSWRRLHLAAYVAWVLAVMHGFTAGTDSTYGPVLLGYIGAVSLVTVAVLARWWSHRVARERLLARSRQLHRTIVSAPPVLGRRSS